jgi:hypothetical protein
MGVLWGPTEMRKMHIRGEKGGEKGSKIPKMTPKWLKNGLKKGVKMTPKWGQMSSIS